MARQLFLIRHAETAEKLWGETDLDRKLTPKGIQDAQLLHKILIAQPDSPQVILHSHAVRTTHTAKLLAASISIQLICQPAIYHATPKNLLDIVRQLNDEWSSVALVGHNPTISAFANDMATQSVGSFAPATVAGFTLTVNRWAEITLGSGVVTLFKEPNIL
ncbi:MAG: histidine phosphatase family protein [Bacteroidetes bacterium]|nr:histidine phosphatase family protein [Bacteroidota bacterium]